MELVQHKDCPYYPCSFEGQSCKHCYCPLYPCKIIKTGGKWIYTKTGHNLWDCSECKVIHQQNVVELLNLDINEIDEKELKIALNKLKKYIG